jgi:hypothetical protein
MRQPLASKETLRQVILTYRAFSDEEPKEERQRAAFRVLIELLPFLFQQNIPLPLGEEKESILMRLRRAKIMEPTDTPVAALDFLIYEIAYAPWLCRLLGLPTQEEEEAMEGEREQNAENL